VKREPRTFKEHLKVFSLAVGAIIIFIYIIEPTLKFTIQEYIDYRKSTTWERRLREHIPLTYEIDSTDIDSTETVRLNHSESY
jgi:hypothetical protein